MGPELLGGFLLRLRSANGFRMMRKKPIGGLFSKLVLPRKQWALCSPRDR